MTMAVGELVEPGIVQRLAQKLKMERKGCHDRANCFCPFSMSVIAGTLGALWGQSLISD